MSNNKRAATFHPGPPVMVHTVILYQAVCHECGWASSINARLQYADDAADDHHCEWSDERTTDE